MRSVGIAELKARLSEYLRYVRRGETVSVLVRESPVARIVPIRQGQELGVRKPAPDAPAPGRVPLPEPMKLDVDIVELLLEERQGNR
jgi:prevent-host-death family protein